MRPWRAGVHMAIIPGPSTRVTRKTLFTGDQGVQRVAVLLRARLHGPTGPPQDDPGAHRIGREEHGRGSEVGVHDALAVQVGHAVDDLLQVAQASFASEAGA